MGVSRKQPNVSKKMIPDLFRKLLMGPGITTPQGWNTTKHGSGIMNLSKMLGTLKGIENEPTVGASQANK